MSNRNLLNDQTVRVMARWAPEGSMPAEPALFHNILAATDEAVAASIAADDDGRALREAGFTAIADAIEQRLAKIRRTIEGPLPSQSRVPGF